MRYFFIDTENINQYSFIDKHNLNKNDKIILFISNNSKNIKIDDLIRITNCKSTIEYEKVCINTKNALDFQLISYLSLNIIASKSNANFFIL